MYELKQHKPWFDVECLHFLDQRRQAKMQWLQDTNQSSLDNQNIIRREDSRHYRNKKKEYLKAKIDDLEPKSKIKVSRDLHRHINDLRRVNSLDLI
jgi:hypothetical protein